MTLNAWSFCLHPQGLRLQACDTTSVRETFSFHSLPLTKPTQSLSDILEVCLTLKYRLWPLENGATINTELMFVLVNSLVVLTVPSLSVLCPAYNSNSCFPPPPFLWVRVYFCSSGFPGTYFVDQAGIELTELCLPLPSEHKDKRHMLSHLVCFSFLFSETTNLFYVLGSHLGMGRGLEGDLL